MKFAKKIQIAFNVYKHKYAAFYLGCFIVPIITLSFLKDVPKVDFFIFTLLYMGFALFSLFVGMYQFSRFSSFYLNTTTDRKSFIKLSFLLLVLNTMVQTIMFVIMTSLMMNYYNNHNLCLTNFSYMSYWSILIFVSLNLLAYILGNFASLYLKRFNKLLYSLVVLILLYLSLKNIKVSDFIFDFFRNLIVINNYKFLIANVLLSIVLYTFILIRYKVIKIK